MSTAALPRFGVTRLVLSPVLVAAAALVLLPWLLLGMGLTLTSATDVVIFGIAVLGLNILVGNTGLVSFGHGAWFGLGAYAAALYQRHLFPEMLLVPALAAILTVTVVGALAGLLILRRRGVYFSLLTLALTAMLYAIAFRWTSFTGGEDGLGGVVRPPVLGIDLADPWVYLALASAVGLAVVAFLDRLRRSPMGAVLNAIRDNEQRARFQGYAVERYKLVAFTISVAVTALAGMLFVFHHRFASADPLAVPFSGELLAMVVIGGMRSFLGPALGALFYILFREFLSIWTADWLFWFGLLFMGFVLFSPRGLVGVAERLLAPFRRHLVEAAAMAGRRIEERPLPAFLIPEKPLHGAILECRDLHKSFGGIKAVDGVDLEMTVAGGGSCIHALIGPNGAGKTTAFNLLSGMFPRDAGELRLFGEPLQTLPPEGFAERGVARSFQITNLYPEITVRENLRLGVQAKTRRRFVFWADRRRDGDVETATDELLAFLGLAGIEAARADELSYGGQRLLDLGMALATRPRLLLLDEPLAGLAAAERVRVTKLIETIANDIPVLVIEHDIDQVLSVASAVTVMNQGRVLVTGDADRVRRDPEVQRIYIGSGHAAMRAKSSAGTRPVGSALLEVDAIDTFYGKSHIIKGASLDVRRGEVVALLGRNGAGKSTLLKSIVGTAPARRGTIRLEDETISDLPSARIAQRGVAYVPQGRGLFAGLSVRDNLMLGRLRRRTGAGVHWDEERVLALFPRLAERLDTPADYLSGGEQQMAAVARALAGDTKILLLDEPFEGLAPALIEELFLAFDRLREEVAILVVEHNLDLVLALADRVYALERGEVMHEGPARPLLDDLDYRREVLWL